MRIFIKGARKSNKRWLPLQASQVLELQQYLQANKFKEGIFLARLTRAYASKRNVCNRVKHMMSQLQQLNQNIIQ